MQYVNVRTYAHHMHTFSIEHHMHTFSIEHHMHTFSIEHHMHTFSIEYTSVVLAYARPAIINYWTFGNETS